MTNLCPICDVGQLAERVGTKVVQFGDSKITVDRYESAVCSACGESVVLPDQAKRNSLRVADAKRASEDLWTAGEISSWRARWGLTQQHAALLLGGGANAFSKYERGEVIQSKSMDLLIRASDEISELRSFLAVMAGVEFGDKNDAGKPEGVVWEAATVACTIHDLSVYRSKKTRSTDVSSSNDDLWVDLAPCDNSYA